MELKLDTPLTRYVIDFFPQIEPKEFEEAIIDEHWSLAMQEKLNQFLKK